MEVQKVVENIQRICNQKGTTPTVAGKESGAGKDLVSNMKRKGTQPSIEKIRLLADYLDVTVDELIGEEKKPAPIPMRSTPDFCIKYESLSPDDQDEVMAIIEMKLAKKQQRK